MLAMLRREGAHARTSTMRAFGAAQSLHYSAARMTASVRRVLPPAPCASSSLIRLNTTAAVLMAGFNARSF